MKGLLTISAPTSNSGRRIKIEIRNSEHVCEMDVEVSCHHFGAAVTGLAMVPCEYRVDPHERKGRNQ